MTAARACPPFGLAMDSRRRRGSASAVSKLEFRQASESVFGALSGLPSVWPCEGPRKPWRCRRSGGFRATNVLRPGDGTYNRCAKCGSRQTALVMMWQGRALGVQSVGGPSGQEDGRCSASQALPPPVSRPGGRGRRPTSPPICTAASPAMKALVPAGIERAAPCGGVSVLARAGATYDT